MLGEQQIDDLLAGGSSRLPVGSSATRMAGSGASARANATRCCSPPDNAWIMMQALAEPDRRQFLRRALRRIGIAGELKRHRDIFQPVMVGIR